MDRHFRHAARASTMSDVGHATGRRDEAYPSGGTINTTTLLPRLVQPRGPGTQTHQRPCRRPNLRVHLGAFLQRPSHILSALQTNSLPMAEAYLDFAHP